MSSPRRWLCDSHSRSRATYALADTIHHPKFAALALAQAVPMSPSLLYKADIEPPQIVDIIHVLGLTREEPVDEAWCAFRMSTLSSLSEIMVR